MDKPILGSAQAVVRCPIGSVFDFVGHGFFQNYRKWCPQVIELEPLLDKPVCTGATARQITLDRGIRVESTFEITTFNPPRFLGLKGLSEPFKSFYEFEEKTGVTTQLSFEFALEKRELFMRPFLYDPNALRERCLDAQGALHCLSSFALPFNLPRSTRLKPLFGRAATANVWNWRTA